MIDETIEELKQIKQTLEELHREFVKITRENEFFREKIDELKGERLKFYTDEIRQTQVINGVHFDIEQLLVFSEYVEQQKMVIAEKDKQIVDLEAKLAEKEQELEQVKKSKTYIMNFGNKVKEVKVVSQLAELQEWVEAEISELKSIEIDTDYPDVIPNQLAVYQKVLDKIKE